jgi:TATA-binding protein-associated factor Taf7
MRYCKTRESGCGEFKNNYYPDYVKHKVVVKDELQESEENEDDSNSEDEDNDEENDAEDEDNEADEDEDNECASFLHMLYDMNTAAATIRRKIKQLQDMVNDLPSKIITKEVSYLGIHYHHARNIAV